jgi:DNA-binding CsgD family transcriptional regulator
MYTPTQQTVKNSKYDLKNIFKQYLDVDDYKKLSHFVYLDKPFKEDIPGTYSVYHMMPHGIAIATNALCINEWLRLHNLPVRSQKKPYTISQKLTFNNNDKRIDTRTEISVNLKNIPGRKPATGSGLRSSRDHNSAFNAPTGIDNITENIWHWYSAECSVGEIAEQLGCTVPNVYYHINKYKKLNPNWKTELELDKTQD